MNPLAYASEAAKLLTAAWKPPCIRYTPEYLSWQFSHPTDLKPIALASKDAFGASTGRRFRFAGRQSEIYVSSHFCARSGAPAAEALGILRRGAELLKQSGVSFIVFAQPGSNGEAMLRVNDARGMVRKPLGIYGIHAAVSKSESASFVTFEEWVPAFSSLEPPNSNSLLLEPRHYLSDPRGCRPAIAYTDGVPSAAALIGATESITTTGIQITPTLYCLRARSAEGIKALISAAGGMALVPNVRLLDTAIVKAAGLRATPARFNGYLFCTSASDPLLGVETVEMEPV